MKPALLCSAANSLWHLAMQPACRRLRLAWRDPRRFGEKYLLKLLEQNRHTLYGRRHRFDRLDTLARFRDRVPLTVWADYEPYIERIAAGQQQVLTREPVLLFEPTSGSSAARKLVPYTASLRAEFMAGIGPWISSLFQHYPQIKGGRAYWQVSPPTSAQVACHGSVPVGFDHDSSYLGFAGRKLFSKVAVGLPELEPGMAVERYQRALLLALLAEENLRLVSVWSPTLLTGLCDFFQLHHQEILTELEASRIPLAARRARDILRTWQGGTDLSCLWPQLAVISCWADGPSRAAADELRRYFPGTVLQAKGLLATEAFVSVPLLPGRDPVLAAGCHFFEFLSPAGDCLLCHELSTGNRYEVVVTTGGGLYRYRLGDIVEVTGFAGALPCLRFAGRGEAVSDLCGEKLHGAWVGKILDDLLGSCRFAMLAPERSSGNRGYVLFVETKALPAGLACRLDLAMAENPNYQLCRQNGQLGPARVFRIRQNGALSYTRRLVEEGMRIGEVKPTALSRLSGWQHHFDGELVA